MLDDSTLIKTCCALSGPTVILKGRSDRIYSAALSEPVVVEACQSWINKLSTPQELGFSIVLFLALPLGRPKAQGSGQVALVIFSRAAPLCWQAGHGGEATMLYWQKHAKQLRR
eukprot:5591711-Amphidinium_carterae.4